jgi:hypothetical protein
MAYLREEKETFEIDYSISEIWQAIPNVINTLNWTLEEKDDNTYAAIVKTKGSFMSYGSTLKIYAVAIDQYKTQLTVKAETPVTTITAMADFGRTKDRIEILITEIAKKLGK